MAKSVALGLAIFLVALVLAPMARSSNSHSPITKEFTVFANVITQGPEANLIPVAGNPSNPINPNKFGTVFVFDVPLRETITTDSPVIGKSQGLNVVSSVNGTEAYLSFSLSFSAGKYKGSTLQLQGSLRIAGVTFKGEVALVSGTNGFRNANGYVFIETVYVNPATMDAVQKLQIYINQDHHHN